MRKSKYLAICVSKSKYLVSFVRKSDYLAPCVRKFQNLVSCVSPVVIAGLLDKLIGTSGTFVAKLEIVSYSKLTPNKFLA